MRLAMVALAGALAFAAPAAGQTVQDGLKDLGDWVSGRDGERKSERSSDRGGIFDRDRDRDRAGIDRADERRVAEIDRQIDSLERERRDILGGRSSSRR